MRASWTASAPPEAATGGEGPLEASREELVRLRAVQRLDEQALFLRREKARLERDAREARARLKAAADAAGGAESDLKTRRRESDRIELDLKGKEEQIRRLTVQLNTVRTNKEYSALQHEIAALQADVSLLEDQLLAILEENDRIQAAIQVRRENIEREERNVRQIEEHVRHEISAIDEKLARLEAEREALVAQVADELRALYEGLMTKRDGRAMVRATPLEGDARSCSGCFMRLTSNTTSLLLGGHELVRCHSCGRILYIDDEEPQPSA